MIIKIIIFAAYFLIVSQISIFSQNVKPDLIIINAKIRTMDEKNPSAEAVAVAGNKITRIGTSKDIRALAGAKTKTIDARGKLVLPGFNDAHVHFMAIGNQFSSLDLREAKSAQEIVEKLKYYVKFLPKGRWILGGGWNHEKWTPAALPTKELIDAATPDHPVFLFASDFRTALVNSQALKLSAIDKTTENPDIGRDAKGEPTGILKNSAIGLVRKIVPEFSTKQWLEVAETASNYAASLGVTSVQDMSADWFLEIYRQLESQGKLKTRIYDCANLFEWQKLNENKTLQDDKGAMSRGGCLKGFSDGDADSVEKLPKFIIPADKAGFQIMLHAIGGAANDAVLTVFERAAKENGARDRRFRVEHAHNPRESDLPRFGKSKIIASMQPHLFAGGAWNKTEFYRTLLDSNVVIAFGSDASITDFNPFLGIYAAVNRRTSGDKTQVFDQTISVEEAVRAYTHGSAYAEFQENVKGTISIGKLADIIVLSDDIFTTPVDKIPQTKVLTTIVNGKVVYEYK
jgi:predicted amidohydrolase YtcJ